MTYTSDEYAEYKRKRLTAEERHGVIALDMLCRSFDACFDMCKGRLADYKYTNRDLGMIKSALRKIVQHIKDSTTEDIKDMITRQARDYTICLARKSPIRKEAEVIMPVSDEWALIDIAISDRCGICVKTAGECRKCALRKLLRKYINEPEPEFDGCGYAGMVLNASIDGQNDGVKVD